MEALPSSQPSMSFLSSDSSPARILERLQMRFGAFRALANASIRIAETGWDVCPPLDLPVAHAILEFAADLDAARTALDRREPADPFTPSGG